MPCQDTNVHLVCNGTVEIREANQQQRRLLFNRTLNFFFKEVVFERNMNISSGYKLLTLVSSLTPSDTTICPQLPHFFGLLFRSIRSLTSRMDLGLSRIFSEFWHMDGGKFKFAELTNSYKTSLRILYTGLFSRDHK